MRGKIKTIAINPHWRLCCAYVRIMIANNKMAANPAQ